LDEPRRGLFGPAEGLSKKIAESFEEISLLYEMTENLRGSSSAAELARLVLDWLVDILPAEQAIIEINTGDESSHGYDTLFQSFGESHLEETSFRRLIEYLQPGIQAWELRLRSWKRFLIRSYRVTVP
jgi:hypothetical protein